MESMPSAANAPAASLWHDSADPVVASLLSHYQHGVPRADLSAVAHLRRALAPVGTPHRVVVIGTNGKTSTATYIARMLASVGVRTGLYTSPHIAYWTERLSIDGLACDEEELLSTLQSFDAVAQSQPEPVRRSLRFFDVLTLVADEIFGRHDVDVAVFESGIGGRLDATRTLAPKVVALSSVGYDHQELLGDTLAEILVEKLGVAPRGATVVSAPLGEELSAIEREWAAVHEMTLVEAGEGPLSGLSAPSPLPSFQRRNLAVALDTCVQAVRRFSLPIAPRALLDAASAIDTDVVGRSQRGTVRGVRFLADTGHNVSAWRELRRDLDTGDDTYVAVVALTTEREPRELAAVLAGTPSISAIVATAPRVRRGHMPDALAEAFAFDGPPVQAASHPELAFELALELAEEREASLLVTGSTYVVADFLAWSRDASRAASAS